MKYLYSFFILNILIFSCKSQDKNIAENYNFKMRSYVEIGRIFDSIKAPYILDFSNGKKRVVLVGCEHQQPPEHQQFSEIERLFDDLKPQLTFNEGGQIPDSVHFKDRNEAIKKNGELTFLKFLSDKAGIKMMNGDMPDSLEFRLLIERYGKEKMWVYYAVERIVIPHLSGAYGNKPFEEKFEDVVKRYFVKDDFPLKIEEQSLDYFKNLYQKYMGEAFDIDNFNVENFDYVNDNCAFCAIGRTSKVARDSVLLTKIDKSLNEYDRILIAFGHGHALAVEKALKEIVHKKRN